MNALTEKKFLSDEESDQLWELLLRHRGERDSIMLRLALVTGARGASEITKLRPDDFSVNAVTIRAAKGSNDRTIPLEPSFAREIQEYIQAQSVRRGERLFKISDRQWRRIWDCWRPNPLKGSHAIRHTAATLLYINCRDLIAVKTFLGHRQINNTMVYLQYVEGQRGLRNKMRGMWKRRIREED